VAAGQQFGFCYPDPAFITAHLNLRDWNKHLNGTLYTGWRRVNQAHVHPSKARRPFMS
jgi:hypothetical protein